MPLISKFLAENIHDFEICAKFCKGVSQGRMEGYEHSDDSG